MAWCSSKQCWEMKSCKEYVELSNLDVWIHFCSKFQYVYSTALSLEISISGWSYDHWVLITVSLSNPIIFALVQKTEFGSLNYPLCIFLPIGIMQLLTLLREEKLQGLCWIIKFRCLISFLFQISVCKQHRVVLEFLSGRGEIL